MNNILIVDDSRAMRNFLRKALSLTSLKINSVHEATNGMEALDLLEKHSIQIIFSDINMPVMDGSAFVAELARREITSRIPVFVVSTDSSTERMGQILALGAKSYISKPFSPETLEREVIRLMGEVVEPDIAEALLNASVNVLETMFFADAVPVKEEDAALQDGALACTLESRGGVNGSFGVAVDPVALQMLCRAFYGEEGDVSSTQQQDLILELTNMLAGSTLSGYSPAHACTLSSPLLCEYIPAIARQRNSVNNDERLTHITLSLEGGLLSVWGSLQALA